MPDEQVCASTSALLCSMAANSCKAALQGQQRSVKARGAHDMDDSGSSSDDSWSIEKAGTREDAWQRTDLNIVLVNPQIPQNAGNVSRTCAATGIPLHLVGPLGFKTDDKMLKRAGLDYWHSVCVDTHKSWEAFYKYFSELPEPKRLVAFTVYGDHFYAGPEFTYQPGDWLVFGAETSGLPPEAHRDVLASGGALVKIPIIEKHVRSINLAVCAGIGAFEAIRQLDAGQHQVAPRQSPSFDEVVVKYFPQSPLAPQQGAGSSSGAATQAASVGGEVM
eukprot:CAMPEP_0202873482 /NCGR_PEP_ID=MMETSP1391-20130828/23330_1 /ASSEMBLY_ACC=CAM_ASM_000867 /TAXON_ID=1034604 /ORGANISM="Chlamydomonas leiostraca, Strain SAG 11-49" /LENGTH=276 /DNA_ID=CAMNT_0049554707 /DNA_START=92 /DNA_END=923 /DNA_ORIENTATION=+